MGQKSRYSRAIPLCHAHHRTGGHGVAFHAGAVAFAKNYGSEPDKVGTAGAPRDGDSDLKTTGWTVEVKNCATITFLPWWRQAVAQPVTTDFPVLFYKVPRKDGVRSGPYPQW